MSRRPPPRRAPAPIRPPTNSTIPQTTTGALSLFNSAKNVLIKYINTIEDVGDMEYRILEPVLRRITSPHQLKKLEANSPQIAADDSALWKKFISRDFGLDAVDKWIPKNPSSWSKVYDKHQREATLAQERAADLLRAEFQGLSSSKESGRTRLVQAGALPPLKHSKPWGSSGGGGGGGGGGWGASTNSWDAKVGSKTKNIIQKARKEAKEIGVFQRLGDPKRAGRGTSAINDGMRQRIRSAEEVRAERDKIAAQSRSNGRASGATMKRKAAVVVDEHEEEENEEERRSKAEEFRRKAMQPRAAMTVGPRAKVAPEKKAVDPFFRPKKTTAAPTNSQGRR